MTGTKKSTFTKVTEVPTTASFDFTSGGTNYGIDYQYLLTSLGATGAITQSGSVDDFPILDKQGSINGIRMKLESHLLTILQAQNWHIDQ
jgi:hypothetical protein